MVNTPSTVKYIACTSARSMRPKSRPRGTDWMPSSPPVNGACRQKKNTICASASVIIAK
ncbi:hypothetical protein D3C83_123270 [compost metagenome]